MIQQGRETLENRVGWTMRVLRRLQIYHQDDFVVLVQALMERQATAVLEKVLDAADRIRMVNEAAAEVLSRGNSS